MSRRSAAVLLGLAGVIGLSLVVYGQSGRMSVGVVPRKGFTLYWENRLEPPTPAMVASFMSVALTADDSPNIITRIIWDGTRRIYLGYEIQVDVLPEAGSFRVGLRRFHGDPQRVIEFLGSASQPGWKELPVPGWADATPQVIRNGDMIALNLLTSSATSQKIVDYLTVQEPGRPAPGDLVEGGLPLCPEPSDLRTFIRLNGGFDLLAWGKLFSTGLQGSPAMRDLLQLEKCRTWKGSSPQPHAGRELVSPGKQ